MENLVEKFMAEEAEGQEGVVSIEYVLVAVAIAAGVAVVFATGLWSALNTRLSGLF